MRNVNRHSIYEFGEFVLDVDKLMLYRGETEISIPPKVVKTLAVLVENRGEILSKDELMERVWEGSVVEESNLSQYLYLLRKTVGNKPGGNPYIETLRRRGYRFTGSVSIRSAGGESSRGPLPRPSLIGRENEIDTVLAMLSRDEVRLVTVSGVGGVGKTTLARAVVDKWNGDHEVFFVELAAINRPELVVSAIASALRIKESPGTPLLDSLKIGLQARSLFLVLDNFEQVALAAPVLSELLNSQPSNLKLLVTSRVALHVEAETLYMLQPLPVPTEESERDQDLTRCESVKLFAERAKAVQPRFELTPEHISDVAAICRQLDGLPLAIELAAARMNFMSPAAVLKRLEKRLDILKSRTSKGPKRQQTMRETIAWSYELLTDSEKQIFARLGIFSGGFDLEGAESVCGDLSEPSALSVLDGVASLVGHNLLVARNAGNGDPRIHMLEVVRDFAVEVLVEHDEFESASRAHAEHFLRLGEEAEPQLVAAKSAAWLDTLETEHDNLREALAWSRLNDPSKGQRLAGSIWRFWWLHGHIREACGQLDDFLAVPSADLSVRAKMLTGATFLNRLAGHSECSRRYAEEGVKLSEATGDLRNGALSFNQLGFLSLDTGDLSEAERMFGLGLNQAQALSDIQILALLNNGLGELSRMKEDYDRAADFYGKALEYNRQAGDRVRQTTCLINLGATALMRENRDAAGSFYRQGLEISSEMEDMNGTLYCLEGLAGSYWASRDPQRSSLLLGAAYAGRRENNLLLEPADKVPYDRSVTVVRDSIGENAFDQNFSNGTKLSLKAAADLALEEAETPDQTSVHSELPARGGRIMVERHGNVLKLVDWAEAGVAENESPLEPAVVIEPPPRSYPRTIAAASLGAVLLLTVISTYVWFNSGSNSAVDSSRELNVIRLTSGIEVVDATISPDGKYFVYHEPEGKLNRIWLQQTGQSTRHEIVPASERIPLTKTFTPDGQFIYFVAVDIVGEPASLYRVPTLGGPLTKILSGLGSGVSFSPDGREMVFNRVDGNGTTYVIKASDGSGGERVLHTTTALGGNAAWSRDGELIAMVVPEKRAGVEDGCSLAVVKQETGNLTVFSNEVWDACGRMEWAPDGRGFYMVGTRKGEGMTTRRDQVYYISYPQGKSRKITSEGSRHQLTSLGVTNEGAVLAVPYNRSSQISAIDPNGESRSAVEITTGLNDGRSGIAPLADGRVAYISRIGENLNVWVMNQDGSDQKQLTNNPHAIEELRSGGDGRYLVFAAYVNSPRAHLYRMHTDGSDLQQLTSGEGREIDSSMSHDGKWIAYDSAISIAGKYELTLWKQSIDGGERVSLNRNDCQMPHFSQDDKYISCVREQRDILILSSIDGTLVRSIRVPQSLTTLNFGARWTPDGKAVAYIANDKGVSNIWTQPIGGGAPKQLTDFTGGSIYHFAYSMDGKRLFVARGYQIRDAILITEVVQ